MPRPELNPLTNPVLGRNLGRWAQVYFTSPPEKREEAVSELLQELENDPNPSPLPARTPSSPHSATSLPPAPVISALRQARDSVQVAMVQPELRCPTCSRANTEDNRFCGYCGNSLEEGAGAPVEVEQQRSETPIVEPDKNLQWLRDKELASLQVSSSRSFGW